MKVVIAIDKFKGSATSLKLAQAITQAITEKCPQATIVTVPIADGGDGTMECVRSIIGDVAETHKVSVAAPLQHLPHVEAKYITLGDTAFMDLATASGMALVPSDCRDVMKASTSGTGEMIAHAIDNGARHIMLGLGGSATCDGGTGILAALGFKFLDKDDNILMPCGENLAKISRIDSNNVDDKVLSTKFTLLSDVDNPLYGDNGAAHVFAPQKGASPQHVKQLDEGLRHFAKFMPQHVPMMLGAGAAGGVTAGMMTMLNAIIKPGIDTLLELAHFDEIISDADFIITGEGRIDDQTMHGKAPAGVLQAAQKKRIPVIAICGSVASGTDTSKMGFDKVVAVTPPAMPLEQAMNTATTLSNVKAAVDKIIIKVCSSKKYNQ